MNRSIVLISSALLAVSALYSADSAGSTGKIIVRIDDGADSRCINYASDKITMKLRRIIIKKKSGVFTEDKFVAMVLNTTLSGNDASNVNKKVTFPRLYTATIGNYSDGLVSVPVEELLFSNFTLSDGAGNRFDTTEIEFSFLSIKAQNKLGTALSTLGDITSKLPIPPNPYSDGFKFFTDYANKVISDSIANDNNIAGTAKEGKISLSFSPTNTCIGDQERTGTIAVVSGMSGAGALDISKEHCWDADLAPVFVLKYAPKPTNGADCSTVAKGEFKLVANPYVGFYLNAGPKETSTSRAVLSQTITRSQVDAPEVNVSNKELTDAIVDWYPALAVEDIRMSNSTGSLAHVSKSVKSGLSKKDVAWTYEAGIAGDQISVVTTVQDSVAFDIVESLKRCAAHGVSAAECF